MGSVTMSESRSSIFAAKPPGDNQNGQRLANTRGPQTLMLTDIAIGQVHIVRPSTETAEGGTAPKSWGLNEPFRGVLANSKLDMLHVSFFGALFHHVALVLQFSCFSGVEMRGI